MLQEGESQGLPEHQRYKRWEIPQSFSSASFIPPLGESKSFGYTKGAQGAEVLTISLKPASHTNWVRVYGSFTLVE